MNAETKGRAIVDFEKIIVNIYEIAFNAGFETGKKEALKTTADEIHNLACDYNEHHMLSDSLSETITDLFEAGIKHGREELFGNDREKEKLNTNYVVDQFADCKTLSDFSDKLKEITNRSYNFM